jgi:hypothetical protein
VSVSLLWMIAIDLVASFSDFLDDDVAASALDDPFDSRLFVTGHQDEVITLFDDALVLGRRDVDGDDARRLTALAVEAQRRLDSVLLGALLDPRVDVAEDLLVASSPLGEVHAADHRSPLRRPPGQYDHELSTGRSCRKLRGRL